MKYKLFLLLAFVQWQIYANNSSIPDDYLGKTPKDIFELLGAPDQVLLERGTTEDHDDVLFFYNNRTYLYLNGSRVWQVRFDDLYKESILGFTIGTLLEELNAILGEPLNIFEDSFVYRREDRGYPVFLRIYFKDKKVEDVYFFRGDY